MASAVAFLCWVILPEAQPAGRDQLHRPCTPTRATRSNPLCSSTGVHLRKLGVVAILQLGLSELWKVNGLWTASLTSDLTMKTQWLCPTNSCSSIAFRCPYSQFRCRNESSLVPRGCSLKLCQESICSGISEFVPVTEADLGFKWSLQVDSSPFAPWLLSWRQNSQAVRSGTMLKFFWLLFPSIPFPFSKNTLLHGKKYFKMSVITAVMC